MNKVSPRENFPRATQLVRKGIKTLKVKPSLEPRSSDSWTRSLSRSSDSWTHSLSSFYSPPPNLRMLFSKCYQYRTDFTPYKFPKGTSLFLSLTSKMFLPTTLEIQTFMLKFSLPTLFSTELCLIFLEICIFFRMYNYCC